MIPEVAGCKDPKGDGDARPLRSTRPPSAGPAARPRLKPTPFMGRCVIELLLWAQEAKIVDPQAGEVSAPPTPSKKVVAKQERWRRKLPASPTRRKSRRPPESRVRPRSAIAGNHDVRQAPDGRVNKKSGKLTATWTSETVIGFASEIGDQPSGRGVEHGGADVRNDARSPYHRERDGSEGPPARGSTPPLRSQKDSGPRSILSLPRPLRLPTARHLLAAHGRYVGISRGYDGLEFCAIIDFVPRGPTPWSF